MHRRVMAGPLQCGAVLRRQRARSFQLSGTLGLDTRVVVQVSEVIIGRRWRRRGGGDFEQVVADLATLANRRAGQLVDAKSDPEPPPRLQNRER